MRDLALALFIFGTIPFILTRPYVGLLVWSWIGYMNPHRLTYGFAYSFPWVQLIAIVTLLSLFFSKENKKIWATPVVMLLLFFFAWTTVTTFFAAMPNTAWEHWSRFGKILMMVVVTLMLVKNKQRIHIMVWVIAVSLGFYGLKGGLFTLLTGGNYHVWGPAHSFIADNNDLAQGLCMILPLWRYLQLQASKKFMKIGYGTALFLTAVAILGTYSRGGLITLVVVSTVLFLKSRRRVAIIFAIIVLLAVAYQFMPAKWTGRMATIQNAESVSSVDSRIQSWKFAANVALHNPMVGGGFKVSESAYMWRVYGPEGAKRRAIHSIYFRVLGEHGFPGIILFVALLFFSWRSCARIRRATRASPQDKWAFDLASMLQVSLLAYMTAGLATTSSYFDLSYQLMALCTLLSGIVAVRAKQGIAKNEDNMGLLAALDSSANSNTKS